jgi:hypothetical protein
LKSGVFILCAGEIKMAKVKIDITEYASNQPPTVREWLATIDKQMIDSGCRVASSVVSNSKRTDGKFTYTSKRTKKSICIINLGTSGNYISLRGNHFINPNGKENILDELPEDVFDFVMKGVGCRLGHCLNLDYSVNQDRDYCVHGSAEVFEYNGQKSYRCSHNGWRFDLVGTTNFEIISRWIALEVACNLPHTRRERGIEMVQTNPIKIDVRDDKRNY